MELGKTIEMNRLFDFYGPLLTAKQQEYLELYYQQDYSLGEISEEKAVSRQAVYDNIKRSEKILKNYEDTLHLVSDFEQREMLIEELTAYVKAHYPNDDTFKNYIERINLER